MLEYYKKTVFSFDRIISDLGFGEGITVVSEFGQTKDVVNSLAKLRVGEQCVTALDYAHGASLGDLTSSLIDEPFLFVVGDKEIGEEKSATALKFIPLEMIVGRKSVEDTNGVDKRYLDFVLITNRSIDWMRSKNRYDPFGRDSGGRVLLPRDVIIVEREGLVVYSVNDKYTPEIDTNKVIMLAQEYNILLTPKGGVFGPYKNSQELRTRLLNGDKGVLHYFGVPSEEEHSTAPVKIGDEISKIMNELNGRKKNKK